MNQIRYLLLTIILATSFSCCKDDDGLQSNNDDNFAEYFTCKINGVEFNPQSTFSCNGQSFYYYEAGTGGLEDSYMLIKGDNCVENKSVVLRIFGPIPTIGNLDFVQPIYADSCSPFYKHNIQGQQGEMFENLISGSMEITTFTPRDSVTEKLGRIEGTFEFTVANENNDSIIHITDGAFRFKVPNIW